MPPLKGIDRGLNGEALKALEESGHGRRLAIVDASYDIPRWAQVVNYQGDSSLDALEGILKLVPVDTGVDHIYVMAPDNNSQEGDYEAPVKIQGLLHALSLHSLEDPENDHTCALHRTDEQQIAEFFGASPKEGEADNGFYTVANNQEDDTLFVRTRDRLPYACVTFIIGHSQTEE